MNSQILVWMGTKFIDRFGADFWQNKYGEAYKKICESGLVIGSWGNVSACESDSIVITPSGIPIDELNSEKLVKVKL